MTMPKLEPVGWLGTATHPDDIDGEESVVYCFSQEMATTYRDESGYEIEPHFSEDQLTEAYEAGKREASEDIEQAALEKWLYDKCPSGDVESVQRQWLESYEYAELAGKMEQAALNERDAIKGEWDKAYEIAMLTKQQLAEAQQTIERQAAQIEMMREALGYRIDHPKVITALSFTPDQALEQFAAKVRSQCESVARSGEWGLTKTGKAIAAAIGRIKDLP